ncbi:DUF6174 domain-containing protein [Anabaena catenula]|uniref:Uncharacterized protein n=1 Tax=Anabaena catenula FACHB-362 TaxID=2692877 RepID=A0ABR8J449_9NOST|nr:DUF6174 domain-containing protein [Anabaena catenula]MBD2692239.1 hypothetical protein [Anabaena catenula FACHB-362]
MRLPIAIGAGLLISFGSYLPLISQPPIQVAKAQSSNSNVKKLRINKKLWNRQNVSKYSYQLTRSCFCTKEARGPVIIEVNNGMTTSVISVETGNPVDPELFKQYDTIPKLFSVVKDAIARKADSLTVKYNPKLGYPTQINIDYSAQMADEELYLTVENFKVLQ